MRQRAWFGVALVALAACEGDRKDPPLATDERSQAVQAKTPPASALPPATIPVAAKSADAPKKPLAFKPIDPPRPFPKKSPSQATVASAKLPERLTIGGGKWTWVNFWAAWCAPCKEEIPRLLEWQKRLKNAPFRLQFISLDDDERQLQQFLDTQPADGLRSSYWLKEGAERDDFLRTVPAVNDSALPFHWFVDPKGKIEFVIAGAVEDADLAQVSAIIAK